MLSYKHGYHAGNHADVFKHIVLIYLYNLVKKHKTSEINDALSITGIKHLIYEDVRNLSGGEFQRLLMARAIAKEPHFLVLPFSTKN